MILKKVASPLVVEGTPKKLAVLMAMAMRWYLTMHIAQWRRFRALLDDTKHHHR
jgi:hypothetical protein